MPKKGKDPRPQRIIQAEYRERHRDRFRAKRILASMERLKNLLSEHPPERGSEWLLSVISIPIELREIFARIEKEQGATISDQIAQYVQAGFLVTRMAMEQASERGENAREHDVQSALVAVSEKISKQVEESEREGARN